MPSLSLEAILIILIAVTFGVLNGRSGSANILATSISTGALSPRVAFWLAAVAEAIGPFVFGVAVATTIGRDVVAARAITVPVIYAGLLAAITWIATTYLFGIPSSTSHALISGLIGSVWAGYGFGAIQLDGLLKIGLTLFLSPFLGMIAGYYMVKLSYFLARGASPRINKWFRRGQVVTVITLALSQGNNDAQKTMGIIVLGLTATGKLETFSVPLWVVAVSAGAIVLGTLIRGKRIIRTLGAKFYRVRPVHGFGAQTASTLVILGAALLGGPVSSTHVMSSSIIGAGSADRIQMIRWGTMAHIVLAWFLTIPVVAALGALFYVLIKPLVG